MRSSAHTTPHHRRRPDTAIGGSPRRLISEDDDPYIGNSRGRCVSRRGEDRARGSPLWGHENPFPRPGPNGRCRFGQETFAEVRGRGRDAP
jgi:hypothetical protein